MKRTVTFYLAMALICVCIFAFKKWEEKKYTVSYSETDWNARYNWVAVARSMLEKSDLPSREVRAVNDSLTKFLNELSTQLVPQMRPPIADSTKKKK